MSARKPATAEPIGPTPEQMRKHVYEQVRADVLEGDTAHRDTRVMRRRDSTILDTLALQKLISPREWQAGNRLRKDFYLSGREQRVCASYGPRLAATTAPGLEESESQSAAHQRWQRAIRAVGKRLSAPLVAVVVEDVAPSEWVSAAYGKSRNSSKAAGVVVLKIALGELADHYGLGPED